MALQYFWYYRPDESFPPNPIVHPEQFGDSDRLNIACTQTPFSASRQKKIVDAWCDILPKLSNVRLLWFSSRVPQRLFKAACLAPRLEGLYIKWSGINDLAPLNKSGQLTYFHLGQSARISSIEPLGKARQLRWLGLELLSRVRDVSVIGKLVGLEGLWLEGSMGTTWRISTLAPLGTLSSLRYLSVANLRTDDMTLAGLFPLSNLAVFRAAKWWKPEEIDEIRRRNHALAEFH
ncbi:MAG TPA: hypothetical protein VGJ26_07105 [Pirellulales bacterium]